MSGNIEDKVRKLIRLAGGTSNIHEAATAFARAQALATAHGLNLDDLGDDEESKQPPREVEEVEQRYLERWKKAVFWKIILAGAVSRANNCQHCYESGSRPTQTMDGFEGGAIAYGQPSDLDTVEYIYQAIRNEVDQMAKAAVKVYKEDPELDPRFDESPRVYGRSWRMGCVDAIALRMKSSKDVVEEKRLEIEGERQKAFMADDAPSMEKSTNALVRVNAAEEYMKDVKKAITKYEDVLGLHRGASFSGAGSSSGYAEGRTAGSNIGLGGGGKALKS